MMYKAQLICLIIIIFIGAFYFSSVQEKNKSTKLFSILICFSALQLLFDMASIYTVNHLYSVSPLLNRVIHIFFMGFLLMLFYIAYKYLEALIEEENKDNITKVRFSYLPLVFAALGVCFLPLDYMETPKGNYSYGPAAIMVYICIAIYIVLIAGIMFKHWKDIPVRKRKAIVIAILSEFCVAIYQAFVPTSLISCLGITLLNLGLYLTVENQDAILVKLLEQETKRADIANQAKTNFLANMSHEIRTPINAVMGMNEMILRESKEKEVREYAKDVSGAAKSLLSIINDILDITKIEAGKLKIIPVEYGFANMIHDVTNMISFKVKAKELTFCVDVDEHIPVKLFGDDVRIRQILVNILNNAVKYTHEGSVALEVCLLSIEEEYAQIKFKVKDTGIGIKPEDIKRLFIPFERIEEKRNRNIEGTGLGMNITMQLLDLLDSRLEVQSEYGIGSEFSFVLRQQIIDAAPIGNLNEQIQLEAENPIEEYKTFEAPDAKILIVDDNEMNRRVCMSLLKHTKMQIEQASSGEESIKKAKECRYDIIFMDHMMPEMDGIETFRILKNMSDYPNKNTPVVILTANAILGAKEQYLQEGFAGYISKPIDAKQLEDMIEKLLDKSKLHYVIRRMDAGMECGQFDLSELPLVDGLDWGCAAAHFNEREALIDNVKFFVSVMEYEARELEKLFAEIHLEKGLKNYSIKVHSMKSSAGNIGIIPLSGMAKVLEDASKNADLEVVKNLTPVFLQYWRNYKNLLQVFSDAPQAVLSADEHQDEIKEIFSRIKSAAEDIDMDVLDELSKQLEQYKFEGEQEAFAEQIKSAILNLDVGFLMDLP